MKNEYDNLIYEKKIVETYCFNLYQELQNV